MIYTINLMIVQSIYNLLFPVVPQFNGWKTTIILHHLSQVPHSHYYIRISTILFSFVFCFVRVWSFGLNFRQGFAWSYIGLGIRLSLVLILILVLFMVWSWCWMGFGITLSLCVVLVLVLALSQLWSFDKILYQKFS